MLKSFSDIVNESMLQEKLLNITDKSVTYPQFNQVIILAGGAGSGKRICTVQFLGYPR